MELEGVGAYLRSEVERLDKDILLSSSPVGARQVSLDTGFPGRGRNRSQVILQGSKDRPTQYLSYTGRRTYR